MPVTFRDTPIGGYPYSVVLDAEAVVQWVVQHGVDLVLHGHMHRSFVAKVTRPRDGNPSMAWHTFYIAGLSSTGVSKEHADDDNTFGVLTFGHNTVQIRWLTVHPKEKSKVHWDFTIPISQD